MNKRQFEILAARGSLQFFPRSARYYLMMYAKEQARDWEPLYRDLLKTYNVKPE